MVAVFLPELLISLSADVFFDFLKDVAHAFFAFKCRMSCRAQASMA
jgi:hypothetical protein